MTPRLPLSTGALVQPPGPSLTPLVSPRSTAHARIPVEEDEDKKFDIKYFSRNTRRAHNTNAQVRRPAPSKNYVGA